VRRKEKTPKKKGPTTEKAFLDAYDPAAYDRPSVAVDVALLSVVEGSLFTLLLQRADHPFKGKWSLPGGFVQTGDNVLMAERLSLDRGPQS